MIYDINRFVIISLISMITIETLAFPVPCHKFNSILLFRRHRQLFGRARRSIIEKVAH